jgi:hypothetical protein
LRGGGGSAGHPAVVVSFISPPCFARRGPLVSTQGPRFHCVETS